jgi:hypothetical protein
MIAKILKAVSGFPGVNYNTNKIDKNKGELLKTANFGPLQALTNLRPQDYINYLQLLSNLNSRAKRLQFHAVLSAKGKSYDKDDLCKVAELWLKEMGYGAQPYLVVFHKDTDNNHVHVVTTRIDRQGKKIDSAYEKIRSVKSLNKILGYEFAMQYSFSTRAQFYMILENRGFLERDFDAQKLQRKIDAHRSDQTRINELKQLFGQLRNQPDFISILKNNYKVDLIFHAAENKAPYGYTIIDHDTKRVFKGSEVMPLKALIADSASMGKPSETPEEPVEQGVQPIYIRPVWISDDVDDEAIHGRNRRRKKKARTNSR